MESFRLCGRQQPLVLTLLPLHPGELVLDVGEPALDRGAELGLPAQPRGEGDVTDPEAEAAPQLGERAELVQLAQAVEPVAGGRARRHDEPGLLEIAEHAGGPAGASGRMGDVKRIHAPTLTKLCQGLRARTREVSFGTWKEPRAAISASATCRSGSSSSSPTSPRERTKSSSGSSSVTSSESSYGSSSTSTKNGASSSRAVSTVKRSRVFSHWLPWRGGTSSR